MGNESKNKSIPLLRNSYLPDKKIYKVLSRLNV